MRNTFGLIPPRDIVDAYVALEHGGKAGAAQMWRRFGANTVTAMQGGAHLIAVLWESAWRAGKGEERVGKVRALEESEAMAIVGDPDFLPSMTIGAIGAKLKGRPGGAVGDA